jgi:hypothetical protein
LSRHHRLECVLRPGSVVNTAQALRSLAAFLAEQTPPVSTVAAISRRHIEDFKPWLAARPGQNTPRVTTATITHRLGTLRMFFIRIGEWGSDDAPPGCRSSLVTCPGRTGRWPRLSTTRPPATHPRLSRPGRRHVTIVCSRRSSTTCIRTEVGRLLQCR